MSDLISVQFDDETVLVSERDNQPFVALRPVCQNLGLD